VSWLKKPTAQEILETRLLAQWRRGRLETNLQLLPLELLLRHQCRRLEIEEAARARMALHQAQRPLRKKIRSMIRSGTRRLVQRLSRHRSLQLLRPLLVRNRRWLLVKLLVLLVRCLRLAIHLSRLCRGKRPHSGHCSSN
jgi:hypothetical protein